MDRTEYRRTAPTRSRRGRGWIVWLGIIVVLIFAVIGVISAGAYAGNRLAGKSSSTPGPNSTGSRGFQVALRDIARAQAQATAIVRQARSRGHSIVARSQRNARRRSSSIIATAHHRATSILASAASSASQSGNAVAAQSGTASGSAGSGASTYTSGTNDSGTGFSSSAEGGTGVSVPVPTVTPIPVTSPQSSASQYVVASGSATGTVSPSIPDLSSVPETWKVVGYNATFGNGPGTAGSITVVNRSDRVLSGVATVKYASGGSASATFSGLASQQTAVLPLNGPAYPGGGYSILVVDVH